MDKRDDDRKAFSHFSSRKRKIKKQNKHNTYIYNNHKAYPNKYNGNSRQPYYYKGGFTNYYERLSKKYYNNKHNSSNEVQPWSEEAKEEERRKQLSDAASKLKNKLKMWNAGKSDEHNEINSEPINQNELEKNGNTTVTKPEEKDNQNKRIMLKNSQTQKKSATQLKSSQNKLGNHNKQKKLQQNLISELMTMPKANLEKVLINPKIHPKVERGMAQIVKQNRLILAQKFRALAESKMNNNEQFATSFVKDVGSFIDADLAIDLCQLPPEVIKQLSEMFQLDLDPELEKNKNVEKTSLETNNADCSNSFVRYNSVPEISNSAQSLQIKMEPLDVDCLMNESNEDFDMNVSNVDSFGGTFMDYESKFFVNDHSHHSAEEINVGNRNDTNSISSKGHTSKEVLNNMNGYMQDNIQIKQEVIQDNVTNCEKQEQELFSMSKSLSMKPTISSKNRDNIKPHSNTCNVRKHIYVSSTESSNVSRKETECLTNNHLEVENVVNCSKITQTDINLIDLDYNIKYKEDIEENIVKEIQEIDGLIHQLNKRRFSLFLKLINMNKVDSKQNDLQKSFIQFISNGDMGIIDSFSNKKEVHKSGKAKKRLYNNQDLSQK